MIFKKDKYTYVLNWDISLKGIVWKLFKSSDNSEREIKRFKSKTEGLAYLRGLLK